MASHLARYSARFGNHPHIAAATAQGDEFWSTDLIRRLDLIFVDRSYTSAFFDTISPEMLASMMQFPPPQTHSFETLQREKLLPTLEIWQRAQENGAEKLFRSVQMDIANGGFDPVNPLHVELEYSRYKISGVPYKEKGSAERMTGKLTLDQFGQLPWSEDADVFLGPFEFSDAETTAREAAAVFNFIVGKQNGRPVLVIGNKRYGSYFVITPIEEHLRKIGISVSHEYVPSFGVTNNEYLDFGHLSYRAWSIITGISPNIFIVDGTHEPRKDGLTRFPAAMLRYLGALKLYNKACKSKTPIYKAPRLLMPSHPYRINSWTPEMTNDFFVGNSRYTAEDSDGDRDATIVCSTGKEHPNNAPFDDPEKYMERRALVFTRHGVVYRELSKDEAAFVPSVQREIKGRVGKYL